MHKTILFAAALAITLSAAAQSEVPAMPKQLTVEEEAQVKVDKMAAELPLTDKQVKKLLKFYKNDIEYRRENFEFAGGLRPDFRGERPQGPPPGGRPPQGMRQGGPGGFPGGFPGGGPGMGPQGGRPPMDGPVDIEEIEKYNQKQEKKLKKILGEELYTQWRSAHPMEAPKLPEIERLQ